MHLNHLLITSLAGIAAFAAQVTASDFTTKPPTTFTTVLSDSVKLTPVVPTKTEASPVHATPSKVEDNALLAVREPADDVSTNPPTAWDSYVELSVTDAPTNATPAPADIVTKRTPGSVYICNNSNFQQPCKYYTHPIRECVTLPSGFLGVYSSFGPDPGATCWLYEYVMCNLGQPVAVSNPVVYPGTTNGFFLGNYVPLSYGCFPTTD